MKSLITICNLISHYKPRKLFSRRFLKQCAVTLILREHPITGVVEVLMIQRADRKGDPWSGHMAFPGGRRDVTDLSNWDAAKRELREEVGIEADLSTQYIGRLSDIMSISHIAHPPMVITPFVLSTTEELNIQANHEVAESVWVPLDFIANHGNREHMYWRRLGVRIKLPCYFFQGKRIWGMSLLMLDELMFSLHSSSRRSFFSLSEHSGIRKRLSRK